MSAPTKPGRPGLPRALVNTYKGGFQPRLGLAWDIKGDGKTAVRLGVRALHQPLERHRFAASHDEQPAVEHGGGFGLEPGARSTLADCPNCRSLDTINPGLQNAAAGLGGINSVDTNFKPPESWQWNLTVSREIMPNTVAEVSYVGNHGLHIWRSSTAITTRCFRSTVTRSQLGAEALTSARRFGFTNGVTRDESTGDSNYHAMQVWIDRRFSNRLAFQAAYTWAHAITNVPTQSFISQTTDVFDYDFDRGDSDLDRRHSFVFNTIYALPRFSRLGSVGQGHSR